MPRLCSDPRPSRKPKVLDRTRDWLTTSDISRTESAVRPAVEHAAAVPMGRRRAIVVRSIGRIKVWKKALSRMRVRQDADMTPVAADREAASQRWEQLTDWPLMVAAVVFLAAYAVQFWIQDCQRGLLDPVPVADLDHLGAFRRRLCGPAVFGRRAAALLARHWYDVLVIALPLLRPLRLLRLIPLLAVLNRRAKTRLRGRVAIYVAGGSSVLAFCAALAVLDAERSSPNANITDFGDAIWWAVTTMTTVGLGDRYPVTGVGRLAAFGLMVCRKHALLGTVTATLASWLVEAVAAERAKRKISSSEYGAWKRRLINWRGTARTPTRRSGSRLPTLRAMHPVGPLLLYWACWHQGADAYVAPAFSGRGWPDGWRGGSRLGWCKMPHELAAV